MGGKNNLSVGKIVTIIIVTALVVAANVLLFYKIVIEPYPTWSTNSKYDPFPEYSGVVEEIEGIEGSIGCIEDEPVVFVIEGVISGNKKEKSFEPVDSIIIGNRVTQWSYSRARIKISGPDGDKWFYADKDTYVYGIAVDSSKLTTITKGQNITIAYGPKEGVDDYDYVFAVKKTEPLRRYVRAFFYYVVFALIPSVIAGAFLVFLLFTIHKLWIALSNKQKAGIAVFILIVIGLMFLALIGIDRYLKKASTAASSITAHAPIIYLYTESDEPVNVRLDLDGALTLTYPEYVPDEGWTVTASPDGTLTDSDGNTYPFLFWEGDLNMDYDLSHGYCVKGCDTEEFLDCALAQLGLTETEAADFKAYWLPLMKGNSYNVITFQTTAYDDAVSHTVTPEPDTVIRVNMLWYATEESVMIEPQDLAGMNPMPVEREGFVFVEWGGEAITPYDN